MSHYSFWQTVLLHSEACYKLGQQISSVKDQIVNILGFVGHTVFVATTALCYSVKAAAYNM